MQNTPSHSNFTIPLYQCKVSMLKDFHDYILTPLSSRKAVTMVTIWKIPESPQTVTF